MTAGTLSRRSSGRWGAKSRLNKPAEAHRRRGAGDIAPQAGWHNPRKRVVNISAKSRLRKIGCSLQRKRLWRTPVADCSAMIQENTTKSQRIDCFGMAWTLQEGATRARCAHYTGTCIMLDRQIGSEAATALAGIGVMAARIRSRARQASIFSRNTLNLRLPCHASC